MNIDTKQYCTTFSITRLLCLVRLQYVRIIFLYTRIIIISTVHKTFFMGHCKLSQFHEKILKAILSHALSINIIIVWNK